MTSEMADLRPVAHDYVNIIMDENGKEAINYTESPETMGASLKCHSYVNISPIKDKVGSSSPQMDGNVNVSPSKDKVGSSSPQMDGNVNVSPSKDKVGSSSPQMDGNVNVSPVKDKVGSLSPQMDGNVNVSPVKDKVGSLSPQMDGNGAANQNFPSKTRNRNHLSRDGSLLRRYLSETELQPRKPPSAGSTDELIMPNYCHDVSNSPPVSTEQAIANAKLKLLLPQEFAMGVDCDNCDWLMDLLSAWQIRSENLTRNYSRILGLLIQIRAAAIGLETRFDQQACHFLSTTSSSATTASSVSQGCAMDVRAAGFPSTNSDATNASSFIRHPPFSRAIKNRQSMFVSHAGMGFGSGIRERDLAENMYPKRKDSGSSSLPSSSLGMVNSFTKDLKDLNTHLGDAIDLCQELAAACFKNNYLSKSSHNHISKTIHMSGFVGKHSTEPAKPGSECRSILQTMAELKQTNLGRIPSAPSLAYSSENSTSYSGKTQSFSGSDFSTGIADAEDASANLMHDPTLPKSCRNSSEDKTSMVVGVSLPGDEDVKISVQSESNSASTYSESDVKYVMSKIATLEEERYRLLDTIDQLHIKNSTVSFVCSRICCSLVRYFSLVHSV